MNTFGRIFRLTDFGESHGPAMGGVIDGVPAGFRLDLEEVQRRLDLRRPGRAFTSQRRESDKIEWLSGISGDGVTLGTPIGFLVPNEDARGEDYEALRNTFRPGHADYTTRMRFGIREHRGGGRASARQTLCRVVAGAVAAQFLHSRQIELRAFISAIGECRMENPYSEFPSREAIENSPVFCPDSALGQKMGNYLRSEIIGRDSVGGMVSLICRGVQPGIGSPVYDRMTARLAAAMMSINAARGVEFGLGMASAAMKGREGIDKYVETSGQVDTLRIHTAQNLAGGLEGGMTTGEDIRLSVAFKPTPTRPYAVESFTEAGSSVTITAAGRHDPCVAIRAVPVVEAMAAITILDELLIARSARW